MRVMLCAIAVSIVACAGTPLRDGGPNEFASSPEDSAALIAIAENTHHKTRKLSALKETWEALNPAQKAKSPNPELLWRLSRLAMVLSLTDTAKSGEWAHKGIDVARKVVAMAPNMVQGHLYLGICMSLLARDELSNSQKLSQGAYQHAKKAVQLDGGYNRGAARRLQGGLLIYAPAWPTSVGDLDEGIKVLEKLTKEYPDEPLNPFLLAEAYRKADLTRDAVRHYKRVLAYPPKGLWRLDGPPYRKRARQALRNLKRMP